VIPSTHRRFVLVGDLQRTSRFELLRESNDPERVRLLEAIASEDADFVAVLGDLVFRGDARAEWEALDTLLSPLSSKALPLLPLLGNHDYGLWAPLALRHFHARFPHLEGRRFYARSYQGLTFLFLDSNRARMSARLFREQLAWYEDALGQAERDPEVRGVLVLVHHPPFTNSRVTGDDRNVQRFFLPPFFAAHKTVAMISGHVHAYERFARRGKHFVVSGGGGGPRVPLLVGDRRRHPDDLVFGPAPRPFHYLRVTLEGDALAFEALGFGKGGTVAAPLDAFALALPR
jgi:3',5'-cyclic AMP phosphodiesterase CpdA